MAKIARVEPWLVRIPGTFWGEFLFVEVETDDGIVGWGEITTTTPVANRALVAVVEKASTLLVGEDPSRIEYLWHKVFRAFTYAGSRGAMCEVLSAFDIALWDILGQRRGLPVYDLLGGPVRESLPIYTHPDQSRFADKRGVEDEIGRIVDAGYTAIKFDPFPHAQGVSPANDGYLTGELGRAEERASVRLTEWVRDAAGPDVDVLIDAHGRFNVPTATRLCSALWRAAGIDWFEEPVPPESYAALAQVKERMPCALAVGERLHTRWDFVPIFEARLADYAMPDVTWTGGISELRKIATMAEAYNIPMTPHDASGAVNLVAGGHVMLAVPNFYRIESSSMDLTSYNCCLSTPLDVDGGQLRISGRPGLGLELDRDYLIANRVAA